MAALGGEVAFDTIEGKKIKVSVPAGAQYGKMLRIREEGVPVPGGRRGDLYLKLLVQVPQKLTKYERELLEQLRENGGEEAEPRPIKLSELKN